MKIGLNISIDVTKLDKARFIAGKNGTYANLTGFIDTDEIDQYGNNGFVTQGCSKEEREQGLKMPILGNSKVFYKKEQKPAAPHFPEEQVPGLPPEEPIQDVPF